MKPLFKFDLSVDAAERNYTLLMQHFEGDLHKALHAQQESPLNYGSEFKPISTLELIFKDHPSWPKIKTVLSDCSTWPLWPLDDSKQMKDIDSALKLGNHKGAKQQQELLLKLVKDEVNRGFALQLPLDNISLIPGIFFAPLNIQLLKTINGEI